MERRDFFKLCCSAMGLACSTPFLQSCDPVHQVQASYSQGKLRVPRSSFSEKDRVMIRSEKSPYPIILLRISEKEHRAIWLRCTHQGCKLNVGGGIYSCPCHGSSFSMEGKVLEGPAEKALPTLKTETHDADILIQLPQ
ncbi:MAG: ubiquinol-cytochrome c reductase iron-sulfur subunit [Flavobacteriales bacterium]